MFKALKIYVLVLLLSIIGYSQVSLHNSAVTRLRIFPLSEIKSFNPNQIERTWKLSFFTRQVLSYKNFMVSAGGTFNIGTTGRYDLTSHSLSTAGFHIGIAPMYKVFGNDKSMIYVGIFARRFSQLAFDLPIGDENFVVGNWIAQYKSENPGSRMLYYNQYGPSVMYTLMDFFKGELFVHSSIDIPVLTTIPGISSGKDIMVVVAFVNLEMMFPLAVTLKGEWELHSPGAKYSKIQLYQTATGAITVRKGIVNHNNVGKLSIETGWKREIDPTGFYRSNALFFGIRSDK